MYPSFAPEDFPAVYKASQKALKTANTAIANNPDSLVWPLSGHTPRFSIACGKGQPECDTSVAYLGLAAKVVPKPA